MTNNGLIHDYCGLKHYLEENEGMDAIQARELTETIKGFEDLLGVRLCIKDHTGRFERRLLPNNRFHSSRYCQCVKEATRGRRLCDRFDNQVAPTVMQERGRAFFKLCHGGIVELYVPLRIGDVPVGAVSIGQYRASSKFEDQAGLVKASVSIGVLRRKENRRLWEEMPLLTPKRAKSLMAVCMALAARMEQLLADTVPGGEGATSREHQISFYLAKNFNRPLRVLDIARELHLSESRASEVIRETFGKPFADVLQDERMRHARDLLQHTSFPVVEVATRCGYADPGYFHRVFRRREGKTPLQFRKKRMKSSEA